MYKTEATDHHLKIGDRIPVLFAATGTRSMRVALIYGSNQPAGNYFLGISAYQANFTSQYDYLVFVKKAPGVSTAAALAAIKTVTRDYPGVTVQNQAQFIAQNTQFINQILNLIYVLLLLAVIIALLGIGNTLALSIYERIREIGLFRAVGMTRSQLRSTIRLESVVIALQGTALGLLIGVLFGWAITHAINLVRHRRREHPLPDPGRRRHPRRPRRRRHRHPPRQAGGQAQHPASDRHRIEPRQITSSNPPPAQSASGPILAGPRQARPDPRATRRDAPVRQGLYLSRREAAGMPDGLDG